MFDLKPIPICWRKSHLRPPDGIGIYNNFLDHAYFRFYNPKPITSSKFYVNKAQKVRTHRIIYIILTSNFHTLPQIFSPDLQFV